jgi:hypothetical protein
VTAAVAGVAAVALYSAALGTRATYDDLSTPYDRLDPLRSQILALTVSSGAAAAIGVGAGVAAVAPRGEGR